MSSVAGIVICIYEKALPSTPDWSDRLALAARAGSISWRCPRSGPSASNGWCGPGAAARGPAHD
jgi:hypothetical protein